MNEVTAPRGLMAAYVRAPLRAALTLDVVVTAANDIAYLAAAGPLSDLLGLSSALLRGTGAFLLAFACAVCVVATRAAISRVAAYAIVVANVVWMLGSIITAAAGWGSPTTAGTLWIVTQAAVVAGFASLQMAAMKEVSP